MKKIASLGTQLCLEACQIIKQCYVNKDTKRYMKEKDDPVTEVHFDLELG